MGGIKRQIQTSREADQRPITLGELITRGIPVFCWCNRCAHHAQLDAEFLAARLGPMFAVPELGGRLRCTGCGARDIATRPAWPSPGQVTKHK